VINETTLLGHLRLQIFSNNSQHKEHLLQALTKQEETLPDHLAIKLWNYQVKF